MNIVKNIFRFLWLVWGAFVFMTLMTLLTPLFIIFIALLGKKIRYHLLSFNFKIVGPILCFLMGIRFKTIGRQKVPTSGAQVLISNHQSMVDIIINAANSPQAGFFLAKKSLTKFPVFGMMVKSLGILVDRTNDESRKKSYMYMVNTIKEGHPIFIYPEGTRNRTKEPLKEFYAGAFKLAIETRVPIVAQTLIGAQKIYNPNTPFLMQPGKVTIYFDIIETDKYGASDTDKLKADVKELMKQRILQHQAS